MTTKQKMRQIALDTETTGLYTIQGDRIVEIGAVEIINRRVSDNKFHCYLNPERSVSAKAREIHGLTDDFLADKPRFEEIADDFINFVDGAELLIHNSIFDVEFINNELNLLNDDKYQSLETYCQITDTLKLSRQKLKGKTKHSLDALCAYYKIDSSKRTLHGALLDSELLAEVYLKLTGGQIFLDFGMAEAKQTENVHLQKKARQLRIFKPEEADMQEHKKFMELIKSKSNKAKVVWDE